MEWYRLSSIKQKLRQGTPVISMDGRMGEVWSDFGRYVVVIPPKGKTFKVDRQLINLLSAEVFGLRPGDKGRVIGMGDQIFTYESENPDGSINVRSEDGRRMFPKIDKFMPLNVSA